MNYTKQHLDEAARVHHLEWKGFRDTKNAAMALATDDSRAAVARRLGVNETTLRNWVNLHLAEEARNADPLAVKESEFEELRRLRR